MDAFSRERRTMDTEKLLSISRNIRIYDFKGNKIRTVCKDDQIWMVHSDICRALGYKNPQHQIKGVPENEKCKADILLKNTLVSCVSWMGLRRICTLSGFPDAMFFLQWAEKEQIFQDYDGR